MSLHTYLAFISPLKGDSISILPCFPKFQGLLGETYVASEKQMFKSFITSNRAGVAGRGWLGLL